MLLAGLSVYNEEIVRDAAAVSQADAYIVGDLFCTKRMCGSVPELFDVIRALKKAGKRIVYQTPMYVTDRCFAEVTDRIDYLYEKDLADGVIVQDLGLLSYLSRKAFPFRIWNCMGIGRSRVSNRDYYRQLHALGADAFLTSDLNVAAALKQAGFPVIVNYGALTYNTMNRECYYCYQNDIFDRNCGRGCLEDPQVMTQRELELTLSVDGHLLGRKLVYDSPEAVGALRAGGATVCVNADSVDELRRRIGEIAEDAGSV